jgi:hypothetical protein
LARRRKTHTGAGRRAAQAESWMTLHASREREIVNLLQAGTTCRAVGKTPTAFPKGQSLHADRARTPRQSHSGTTGSRLAPSAPHRRKGDVRRRTTESCARRPPVRGRRQTVGTVPPSMTKSEPTTDDAALETRNPTTSATSAGWAGRPRGIPPSAAIRDPKAASRPVPLAVAIRSTRRSAPDVWMNPGDTVLTRTPWGASSFASPLL